MKSSKHFHPILLITILIKLTVSLEDFNELILRHRKLYDEFSKIRLRENSELKSFMKILVSDLKMTSDFGVLVENPLTNLILTKRLSIDLENYQNISTIKDVKLDKKEFWRALENLVNSQRVFNLKTEDLANGIIDGVKCSGLMTSRDFFDIGNEFAIMKNDFNAEEFLKAAYKLATIKDKVNISKTLLSVLKRLKKFLEAFKLCDQICNELESSEDFYDDISLKLFQTELTILKNNKLENVEPDPVVLDIEAAIIGKACRKEIIKSPRELSKLFCSFFSNNFFTKLARFKMEVINENPVLLIFH